ncbi:MAG: hypothetical protein OQJ93_07255 [Ignavibacteriaceae bacterium]|nr:hypothetical protein [Ignavibacteriaceae bacterium]
MVLATGALVGAGVGIVSGLAGAIAQALNNAKTNKAEAQEIAKLEKLSQEIQKPDFSVENLDPTLVESVFEYNPESVPFIQEIAPQIVEKSPIAQQSQGAQLGALDRFEQLAETGEDSQLIAAREGAERESMEALSRAQAEREAMSQRRGLGLGSGAQMALQQADLTGTAQRQQEMNENAAADAALRRMQANQQAGSLGSQITGQELGLASENTGIINAFNQRQALREQGVVGQNVQNQNQAQLMATQNQQDLAARNAALQNQAAQQNRIAQMQSKAQDFNAEMDIYGAKSGVGRERMGQVGRSSDRTARTISGVSQSVGSAGKGLGSVMGG